MLEKQESGLAEQTAQSEETNTVLQIKKGDASPQNSGAGENKIAQDQSKLKTEENQDPQGYGELALPNGADGKAFDEFKTLAQELNLSPGAAQKLLDLESKVSLTASQSQEFARQEILERWADQTKELFGPRYQQDVFVALRAADLFGGPELRDLLEATGLGNHPVIVKTFNQIGKLMSEDECVGATAAHGSDRTFTEALYGVKPN